MPIPENVEVDEGVPEDIDSENKPKAAPVWQKQEDVLPIVSDLIETYHEKLSHIRPNKIGYVSFSKKKSNTSSKIIGLKPMMAMFTNVDYILTIHYENWVQLDKSEKYLLVLRELLHIHEEGFDEGSKNYRKYVKVDIQDFAWLIGICGINGENSEKILQAKERMTKNKNG